MTQRSTIIIVLALIAAGSVSAWWWSARSPTDDLLVLQGNVEVRQVNLAFKVAGRIVSLAVDEGATIVAGQKLASLEKVYFEDSLRQARAQRDQAAANVAKMEAGNRPEEIAQADANVLYREALLLNARQARERAEALPAAVPSNVCARSPRMDDCSAGAMGRLRTCRTPSGMPMSKG